ncbi:hypothetical protein SAMN04488103_101699 [Gemmobacter aquatilis]|uniref:Putative DNA-binding domain-containing protein n=1 Tax=Gemmobacter aquatilis TaxID=933059 RepID=A0A1H7ZYQ7_9RHOB|nr:DNA-binding domain-containing protein [Gemmobacter aquatilis]SEM63590.1 hypothetical protein SAMN04488103_101699 [Gemmobacter aquatilis]
MLAHPDFITAFRQGLFNGTLPPGLTVPAPDEAERRFAVYRNNVAHSLGRALAARFPVIERLVGPEFFAAMARVYLGGDLPASPLLFQWGDGFAGFLQGFPPVAGLPYLPDVARLEFARGRAWHAADHPPAPPEALAAAAAQADTARLALHPSVALLASDFAVVSIWQANQPDALPAPIDATQTETALILRDRRDAVRVLALPPGDAAFARALQSGAPLLIAAESAAHAAPRHDPARLLLCLMQAGALITPDTGEPR